MCVCASPARAAVPHALLQAYNLRLKIKDQIVMFNYLLDQQVRVRVCRWRPCVR